MRAKIVPSADKKKGPRTCLPLPGEEVFEEIRKALNL